LNNNKIFKIIAFGIMLSLLIGFLMIPNYIAENGDRSRTVDIGNEPPTGYSEDIEIFEIYHDNDEINTLFSPNENVNVRITSNNLNWAAGGPQRENQLEVRGYSGNLLVEGSFIQQSGGPPYVYEASFQAPGGQDCYLITAELRDSPQEDKDEFIASDVIQVGNGGTPPRHILTCSDHEGNIIDWIYGTGDIVYVKVYTPDPIRASASTITFADYIGNEVQKDISELEDSNINNVGDDSIIALDLVNDLDLNKFPDHALKGNYWYTISVDLTDQSGTQMANDWATQIKILPPPVISQTYCDPVNVLIEGSDTTTIYTEFSDEDASGRNEFMITLKVQSSYNIVIVLADNYVHAQDGLSIVSLGNNNYRARYTWNPSDGLMAGYFDLYAMVYDGQNGVDEDGFNDNPDELTLLKPGGPPTINSGNVSCSPTRVNKMTNDQVNFYANFTDANNQFETDDFSITIRIRDTNNNEITIAQNKRITEYGNIAGSGIILILETSPNLYMVYISWDPDSSVLVGTYDLYFSVSTVYGTATDGFGNNQDELEIFSGGNAPDLDVGDTTCIPSSLDIVGNKQTMIYCEFTDLDYPLPASFNVTFKVRPPNNRVSDAITLVDNMANGGLGEFGNAVSIEESGSNYIASYDWDPPENMEIGEYDLYFLVRDQFNNTVEDPFVQNNNELELISSVTPPTITIGTTKCVPSSVNKLGAGTTKIYCEFTDSQFTSVDDFNVTFSVRDPLDNEIVLVNDKPNGGLGEDATQKEQVEISYSGTVFTAWYEWDPPVSVEPGNYDLYFGVKNKEGGYARDNYNNNLNELSIETSGNPPSITNTDCFPPTISVKDDSKVSIYGEFIDEDNPPVTNFTITMKVRDPYDNEIVLVNNKPKAALGEFGGAVDIIISGTGFMASYDWDPAADIHSGKYDLYFSVKDDTYAEARSDYDDNKDELELTGGAVPPGAPEIEASKPTHKNNEYTFTVTYIDSDNDPPSDDGISLIIGTDSYQMKEVDSNDENYSDGKKYYYTIDLADGNYTYYFKVTNLDNEPHESEKTELTVSPDSSSSSEEDNSIFIIAIAAIIITIIVILLLFLILKNKKTRGPSGDPTGVRLTSPPPLAQQHVLEEHESNQGQGQPNIPPQAHPTEQPQEQVQAKDQPEIGNKPNAEPTQKPIKEKTV
jgi:hypothetical protein